MTAAPLTDEARVTAQAYDAVPYPSHAFSRTKPDRLATVGAVFGVHTAAPATARVLELGCASGGNLLPHAAACPGGSYLGVDASPRQVALGQAQIARHGLTNARIEVADLTTWSPEPGAWDYVICHGVYAWVGPAVRDGILRVAREALAPGGVACISYNTPPGWGILGGMRDALLSLGRPDERADRRAAHSRHLLDVLGASLEDSTTPWARLVREVRAHAESSTESYLMHEYLGAHHHPQTVSQFAVDAHAARLRYLGDASFATMLPHTLPQPMRERLTEHASGVVPTEQLLDLIRGHSFRTSLLVRDDEGVQRDLGRFDPRGFFLASRVVERADPERPGTVSWHAHDDPEGPALWSSAMPWVQALVRAARRAWPRPIPFDEAAEEALDALAATDLGPVDGAAREVWKLRIGQVALHAYVVGVVDLHRTAFDALGRATDPPVAWSWAREEVTRSATVTTQRHETVSLPALDNWVISQCDGTRTRAQLLAGLREVIARRAVWTGEVAEVDEADLDTILDRLSDLSLMVSP